MTNAAEERDRAGREERPTVIQVIVILVELAAQIRARSLTGDTR